MQRLFGQFRPDEHAGAGFFDGPSRLVEGVDQDIPAFTILFDRILHLVFELVDGDRRRHLDRGEHPVVEPALDLLYRADQFAVAHDEADPPAGHVVALGEGVALHRHVLGPLDREDRGRFVAVEGDVGVGDVADDVETLFSGHVHQPFVESRRHRRRGRVVGKVDDDELWPGHRLDEGPLEIDEKEVLVHFVPLVEDQLHLPHRAAREHEGVGVDRIGRIGYDGGVARIGDRLHQMDVSLFAAHRGHRLGFGIQRDTVAALVPVADGKPQFVDPLAGGVSVGFRFSGRFDELFDDLFAGGSVGIAHTEVDHVFARTSGRHLQIVHFGKYVFGQTFELFEFYLVKHDVSLPFRPLSFTLCAQFHTASEIFESEPVGDFHIGRIGGEAQTHISRPRVVLLHR